MRAHVVFIRGEIVLAMRTRMATFLEASVKLPAPGPKTVTSR
jgi:hypothetical protein